MFTRRRFLPFLSLSAASVWAAPHSWAQAGEPSAEEVQAMVRHSYIRQNLTLKGRLRNDSTGQEVPLTLSMLENTIRFRFENPTQIINLDLNEKGFVLREVVRGKNTVVPRSRYTEKVRGMDITYEDLSMRFLYWPNPKKLPDEIVKRRDCYKLRLDNPDATGAYGVAHIYVEKKSAAIARMEGFDREGKPIKRYEVISVMKIDNGMMVKQMRVETFDAATSKTIGRTYLELEK